MASSTPSASVSLASAEPSSQSKHDVFLSFRGEARKGIVSYLYHELQNRGIQTFMDDQELQTGMPISPSLLAAIEESRCAIVVLSPNYASSTWCLDELAKIVQCFEAKRTMVLPIFYNVDPSDVRHQRGSFAEAFTKHEEKFRQGSSDDPEKVKRWRDALTKVANLSGLDSNKYGSERELVQRIVELVCSNVRPISIMSSDDFEAFEATRQAMDELMKALENNEVATVGVYGMGGVGKTTMVKHVGEQAQKNGIFHHVIMAVISQTPDFRRIQGTFADMLGLTFVEETEIGRANRLMKKLKSGNKILIILDDIWDRIDLSCIGIPSYNELQRCNSKVLLTTRRLHVCHTMESQANIALHILSEEDAWNLFVRKARRSFEKFTDFYDVARKVARECAGLPVALIAVARALGDKDFGEWKEAARQLEMSQRANLDEKDVFKCIKLSYDYLDDNDAKFCFLLCCLFPEDYDIQIDNLIMYGFGTGLFRDVNITIENARVKANLVTRYLKASCLLLDSTKDGCVRMHDVIRDMAMSIALSVDGHASLVKTRSESKVWPMDAYEGYSAISLMESNICNLPNELVCPKLRVLLLQGNIGIKEIPKTFFQSPNDLRVLDLRGTSISSLPPSFSLLTNLHALHLDFCESIIDISILTNLKKLEILSTRGCLIERFPKEMGNLTNLRMLDFTGTSVKSVPSQVISRLHRLEELYIKCSFGDWGSKVERILSCFLRKNAEFDEFTSLSSLKALKVSISGANCLPQNVKFYPNWVNFDICISRDKYVRQYSSEYSGYHHFRYQHSRALTLDTTMNTLPDWFINVVTRKAETLFYTRCEGLSNILEEHDRGRLHGLKYLTVSGPESHHNLKVLLNTITWPRVSDEPVFENLEVLDISFVHCLKQLCVGKLPPGSLRNLRNLKTLNVLSCYELVKPLLQSKLLHRLQNLEKLDCCHMHSMEYVFGFERHEPQQIFLTKLKMITLSHVYQIISIWKDPAPPGIFQNLKKFSISNCRWKLKYLFTSDVARCLLQLEHLWVEDCSGLDRIIETSDYIIETSDYIYIWSNKIVLPKLKNIVLIGLPKLTRLSSRSNSGTVDFGIECPSLEHLYVNHCPQFSISASDFHSSNQVQLNDYQNWNTLRGRWHSGTPNHIVMQLLGSRLLCCGFLFYFYLTIKEETERDLQWLKLKKLPQLVASTIWMS